MPSLRVRLPITSAANLQVPHSIQDDSLVRDTNVAVRMRDGVILRADVLRPRGGGRFPVLVYRTPYGKSAAAAALSTATKAVARGYAVVLQDVRGRYASDGEYLAYQQEGHDGYDTIEWAAKQPWSTGAVGTYGLSYPGAVQWLAAIESPPHLKAMVPAMTFASPMQFWYSNGVWDMSWISWIYHNIAPDRRHRLGLPAVPPSDTTLDKMRGILPLSAMSDLRTIAPWYYTWLRHPAYDPWWAWAELRGKYGRTSAAVMSFSAWYDEAYGPHGAASNFMGLVSTRRGRDPRAALIIGPWTHGVPRPTSTKAGDREFGEQASVDYDEIVLRWMDRYVRGKRNGVDSGKRVRVFVMGSNQWIEANSWPLPGIKPDTVRLARTGDATTIESDPMKPVTNAFADRSGAHDYRDLANRSDVVVFDMPPLEHDLTVVGAMQAQIHISSTAPDVDIWVKVQDVAPDGTAYNLMSSGLDVVRASYRNGRPQREMLGKGVTRIDLRDLYTGNTFKAGHHIRVIVAPSFFPDFSRNLQSGELEATSARARVAKITVHHSRKYPSRLILPVCICRAD